MMSESHLLVASCSTLAHRALAPSERVRLLHPVLYHAMLYHAHVLCACELCGISALALVVLLVCCQSVVLADSFADYLGQSMNRPWWTGSTRS